MRYGLTALLLISINAAAAVAPDGAKMQPDFTSCANLECGQYVSAKFHMHEKYLTGGMIRGETFFADPGSSRSFKTAFRPKKIIAIYNHNTGHIFTPGKDYLVNNSGFSIPEGSSIEFAPEGFVDSISPDDRERYGVRLTTEFQGYQYSVDYLTSETYSPRAYGYLGDLSTKLGKKPISITFFGDSITDGANATGADAPPYQPGYAGLVAARLNDLYPTLIHYRNNSVGGWSAINATASVEYRVNDQKSDLVVLAFGMNDSGGYTPDQYEKNIKYVIKAIRAKQPNCPILLVSTSRANPKATIQKKSNVDAYRKRLIRIARTYKHVALADVTSAWDRILKNKSYYDITGNGLNHPNDYGHRIIAEVVLDAIMTR